MVAPYDPQTNTVREKHPYEKSHCSQTVASAKNGDTFFFTVNPAALRRLSGSGSINLEQYLHDERDPAAATGQETLVNEQSKDKNWPHPN